MRSGSTGVITTKLPRIDLRSGRRYGGRVTLPALSLVATPSKRRVVIDLARRAEELGFPAIACPSLGSAVGLCASLAHETSTIRFYTAIQGIYGSTAAEMSSLASHVHETSGGRFALGLGVSHEPMVKRLGVVAGRPLSDIRQYVDTLRANEKYAGEQPPIYLAALRDKMLDLAQEIASGALWANASHSHTVSQVRRVTRDRDSFHLANMIPTVVSDDAAAAKAVNRKTMINYVRLPNYRNYWRAAGYVEEMDAVERVIADGGDVTTAMSDRWLTDCTLAGPASAVREGFERWVDLGIEPIAVVSSTSGGQVKAVNELFDVYS